MLSVFIGTMGIRAGFIRGIICDGIAGVRNAGDKALGSLIKKLAQLNTQRVIFSC